MELSGRPMKKKSPEIAFWEKVQIPEAGGCWLWIGCKDGAGYGRLNIKGVSTPAYRWAYERYVGKIPARFDVDHLCREPSCVNPMHLEAVTRSENIRRGIQENKGRALADKQQAKTHCPHGHPYAGSNLLLCKRKTGHVGRVCKVCAYAARDRWIKKSKEARL